MIHITLVRGITNSMGTAAAIRAYFEAFNNNDPEAIFALLHPDVAHDINEGSTEVGIQAFRDFKAHMDRCYKEQIVDLQVWEDGTRGASEFKVNGSYIQTDGDLPAATGQSYSIPAAAFFDVVDGKITRITSYYNLKAWIAAIS